MARHNVRFSINPGWKYLFAQVGLTTKQVLTEAKLPQDLFSQQDAGLSTEEYFRLWSTMEGLCPDPSFPLTLVRSYNTDIFDPPLFAAYCSPNLNIALQRFSQFKLLIGPMKLDVSIESDKTRMSLQFLDNQEVPRSVVGGELGFFVHVARIATHEELVPIKATVPCELPAIEAYEEYLGVRPELGDCISMQFSSVDASKPFHSENSRMWEFFEPSLRKRLAEIRPPESVAERVKNVLLEMLPSGQASVDDVASRLFLSRRTLQRRLSAEETNFKNVLTGVRQELAHHYIKESQLPYSQISFLLGYEDPNSFFRAFHDWTGTTPSSIRTQVIE